MYTATIGAMVFDHYVKFLGQPADGVAFRIAEGSIQILTFPNVFPSCMTFCTLGFGPFSQRAGRGFHEVLMAVDAEPSEVPNLLAMTLLTAAENDLPIEEGISLTGIASFAPNFVRVTRKEALFFTDPFLLPRAFAEPHDGNLHAHILMAVPISRGEHEFVKLQGGAALVTALAERDVDPLDVMRTSALSEQTRPGMSS
jgi:hypothetical protein